MPRQAGSALGRGAADCPCVEQISGEGVVFRSGRESLRAGFTGGTVTVTNGPNRNRVKRPNRSGEEPLLFSVIAAVSRMPMEGNAVSS